MFTNRGVKHLLPRLCVSNKFCAINVTELFGKNRMKNSNCKSVLSDAQPPVIFIKPNKAS